MRDSRTSKMASDGSSSSKISKAKGKSRGWAAFDHEQRDKQGLGPIHHLKSAVLPTINTFESPSNILTTSSTSKARSFSSVLKPPMHFPSISDDYEDSRKEVMVGDSNNKSCTRVENNDKNNNVMLAREQLKEVHSWADDGLIEDILRGVDNDLYQASTLLESMVLSDTSEEYLKAKLEEPMHFLNANGQIDYNEQANGSLLTKMINEPLEESLGEKLIEETCEGVPCETKLSESTAYLKLILGHLKPVPVEPEWEEDDVYLSNRKHAITAIRSAAKHSKAASNAFLRGDHYSAQQLSLKARGEWVDADKQNAKAAKEILSIRNSKNDIWKLDLHGLHASEAVLALEEHLWRIETKRVMQTNAGIIQSSLESLNRLSLEAKMDKEGEISFHSSSILQVITGSGNHSRGQASLPAAVRAFLIEHGYRFDEARPGMIAVRPKFRHV